MNTTTNSSQSAAMINDMVEQIRADEAEDQMIEQDGNEGNEDEGNMERPTIGKDIKLTEPESRKKYTPIRARNSYKELLRKTAQAMSFLEHVTNRRAIYDVDDERDALSDLSKAAFRTMKYIEERQEERKKEKDNAPPEKADKDDKNGNKPPRPATAPRVPEHKTRPRMSLE